MKHRLILRKAFIAACGIIIFFGPIIYFTLQKPQKAEAAWYDDNWMYRQTVTVTSASSLTDFTIHVVVDTATLITAGKMQSDCDDIRITDNNGKLLSYSLDTGSSACNTSITNIWFKAASISSPTATFYLYYGNPSATNNQNASKVFYEYDLTSFTKTDPNSRFVVNNSQQITVTSMSSNEDAYIYKSTTARTTGTIDAVISTTTTDNKITCIGMTNNIVDDCRNAGDGAWIIWRWGGNIRGLKNGTTQTSDITSMTADGTKYYVTIKFDGVNANFSVYSNAARTTQLGSTATLAYTSSVNQFFAASSYNDNSSGNISDVIQNVTLRKYTATEPTVTIATEEKAPAPVGYWKFDDATGTTAQDSTQNNNDGTLTNSPTWQSEDMCVSGKCLRFNGSSNYVDMGTGSALQPSQFTISAWIRVNSNSASNYEAIISNSVYGNFYGYALGVNTNNQLWGLVQSSNATTYTSGVSGSSGGYQLNKNQWYQVELTYNSSAITLYVNGAQVATQSSPATLAYEGTDRLRIGTWAGTPGAGAYFNGFIDEPKIYNYVRTASQIQADYNAKSNNEGSSAQFGAPNKTLSDGLVTYLKMDETTANTCGAGYDSCDSSGNGINGGWQRNTTTSTTAKFGSSTVYDGADDDTDLSNSSLLSPGNGDLTLAAWVNTDVLNSATHEIYRDYGSDLDNTVTFGLNTSNKFSALFRDGDGDAASANGSTSLSTGTWYHVVTVKKGTTVTVYLNGVQEATATNDAMGTITTDDGSIPVIGMLWDGTNLVGEWDGYIDEFRAYKRALSSAEVSQLYTFAPGPVGYWKFDENTGSSANDSSTSAGTANWNGTLGSQWIAGKFGGAGNFNGSDNYLLGTVVLPGGTTSRTVSAWVKTTSASLQEIFSYGGNSSGQAFTVGVNGSSGIFVSAWTSPQYTVTATVNDGRWHYVTLSYDGTNAYTYLDGVLLDSRSFSINTRTTDVPLIGSRINQPAELWTGQIDDVKFYNYTRTQKQIVEDMNGNHPAPGSPVGSALGYWKFDEGVDNTCSGGTNDACNSGNSGTTLDGAQSGNPTWSQSGKFGKALTFDGTNDEISVADSTTLDSLTSDITISMWVNPNSTQNQYAEIIGKHDSIANGSFVIEQDSSNNNQYYFSWGNGSSFTCNTSSDTTTLTANTWQYFVVVKSGATVTHYVNGRVTKTCTGAFSSMGTNNNNLYIGRSAYTTTNRRFTGGLDEVKIYNLALTTDQIKADMNQGKSQVLGALGNNSSYDPQAANQEYCVWGDSTSCNAPVGRWDFEEGSGTSVYDTSGNNNTGSWNGSGTQRYKVGKVGKAANFNGSDDYIRTSSTIISSGAFTFSAWFKQPSFGSTRTIIAQGTTGAGTFIGIRTTSSSVLEVYIDGVNAITGTTTLLPNTWYHVEVTHNSSASPKTIVYLNGRQEATQSNNADYTGNNVTIGASPASSPGTLFNGQIDNARIFNYARSAAQVAWDYNRGDPVGWWRLDDCQGTTLIDSSGNANTGTLSIGGTGSQSTPGTCSTPTDGTGAWYNARVGKRNSSLGLDGSDDYATIGNSSSFNYERTQPLSISAWVYITGSNGGVVWSKGQSSGNFTGIFFWASTTDGNIQFEEINNTGTNNWLRCFATGVTAGTWNHIVATYDGSSSGATGVTLYINGTSRSKTCDKDGLSASILNSVTPEIGGRNGANSLFPGQIDDLRIYNYALTSSQVKTLMNNGAVDFAPSTGTP